MIYHIFVGSYVCDAYFCDEELDESGIEQKIKEFAWLKKISTAKVTMRRAG